jgi:hypothetical protein
VGSGWWERRKTLDFCHKTHLKVVSFEVILEMGRI